MSIFLGMLIVLMMSVLGIQDHIFQSKVISNFQTLFSIKCVILVSTDKYKTNAVEIQKYLSRAGEGSSIFTSKQGMFEENFKVKCRQNRPLVVIFSDTETFRYPKTLESLPSYPRWLLFTNSENIENQLANIYIPFNCEFFVAKLARTGDVVLTEVYQLEEGRPLSMAHFGVWTADTGLKASNLSLYARRSQLQGMVLQGVRYSPPVKRGQQINDRDLFWHNGLVATVWHVLESRMNFTTVISSPEDGVFGFQTENGTWTGMIGALVDKKASVAIDDVTVSTRRLDVVDFLIPLLNNRVYIHIRKPEKAVHWNHFSPFSSTTWSAIVGSILLAGLTSTVARWVLCRTPAAVQDDDQQPPATLLEAFVEILALFCQQGKVGSTHHLSVRLVLISAGYASVILLAAYSGVLTSLLAVGQYRLPFDSLRGFMDDGSYTLGLERSAAQIYFNLNTTNPVVRELFTNHVAPYEAGNESLESDVGMRQLCVRRRFSWLTSETFEASNDFGILAGCKVAVVPEHVTVQTVSIAVAKGLPFRGLLDHNIRYLRDTGVLNHIKLLVMREQLSSNKPASTPAVTQEQVLAIELTLAMGVVCSLAVLVAERLRSKLCRLAERTAKVRPRVVRMGEAKTRK